MASTIDDMHLDILEVFHQASSPVFRHPILIAKEEVHSDLHVHSA